jgi:multidrug efflux pump
MALKPDGSRMSEEELKEAQENKAATRPGVVGLFSVFRSNVPQLKIQPDPRQCLTRGVSMRDFSDTLRIFQGSLYVNDFNKFDRTWQVIVQADAPFRERAEDLNRLKVRNRDGQMVQLGTVAGVKEANGPLVLTRYNMYPAATINGSAAPGISSRRAIDLMEQLAEEELPRSMKPEWTDLSYLELQAGSTGILLFAFGAAMVFLVLAAQYESWSLPLAVILVVPLCLLSGLVGVNLAGLDVNIFTQVGFVVLVGLASKNAILIVEYAKVLRAEGHEAHEATTEACRLRLRPIVMTSVAFILGVVPLILSHGAGAEMRKALGTAVFSGMVGVTVFGVFLTPVFFYVIDRLSGTGHVAARLARRAGDVGMDLLTLGPAWRAGARLIGRRAANGVNPTRPGGT